MSTRSARTLISPPPLTAAVAAIDGGDELLLGTEPVGRGDLAPTFDGKGRDCRTFDENIQPVISRALCVAGVDPQPAPAEDPDARILAAALQERYSLDGGPAHLDIAAAAKLDRLEGRYGERFSCKGRC